jgi:hypothetical protein
VAAKNPTVPADFYSGWPRLILAGPAYIVQGRAVRVVEVLHDVYAESGAREVAVHIEGATKTVPAATVYRYRHEARRHT